MAAETRNCGAVRRGAMPPPKDVVKIAIQMVGAIPQLIELQQVPPGPPAAPRPAAAVRSRLSPSIARRASHWPLCSRTSAMRE